MKPNQPWQTTPESDLSTRDSFIEATAAIPINDPIHDQMISEFLLPALPMKVGHNYRTQVIRKISALATIPTR